MTGMLFMANLPPRPDVTGLCITQILLRLHVRGLRFIQLCNFATLDLDSALHIGLEEYLETNFCDALLYSVAGQSRVLLSRLDFHMLILALA